MTQCDSGLRASSSLASDLQMWVQLKAQIDRVTSQLNRLRDRISAEVEATGEIDESGHIRLPLPEAFEWAGKRYEGVKRERRVTASISHERAEALADAKGLRERIFPLRPALDEQELYVLYQERLLTEAEIDSLVDRKVTWAFKPEAVAV
jgi:hypothetical protein